MLPKGGSRSAADRIGGVGCQRQGRWRRRKKRKDERRKDVRRRGMPGGGACRNEEEGEGVVTVPPIKQSVV
jgi:hypothetical protein